MNNKKKLKKWLKCILEIMLLLIVMTAWYEIPVTEYITISGGGKVKEPVKFALVTDLHSGYYGKDEAELIRMIDRATPDAILMSGDIFDDRLSMDNARIFCEQIAGKYRCFYVTGNHEIWSPNENRIKEYLRSIGITVLDGTAETLTINGSVISFCGVDDPTYMTDAEWAVQLTSAETAADSASASDTNAATASAQAPTRSFYPTARRGLKPTKPTTLTSLCPDMHTAGSGGSLLPRWECMLRIRVSSRAM